MGDTGFTPPLSARCHPNYLIGGIMGNVVVGYDLNVWDRGGYEHDYAEGSEAWRITVHELEQLEDGSYQTGKDLPIYLDLTPDEAKSLTLGWDKELGGLYTPDSDFFLDPRAFMDVYGDAVPVRVRQFVGRFL